MRPQREMNKDDEEWNGVDSVRGLLFGGDGKRTGMDEQMEE